MDTLQQISGIAANFKDFWSTFGFYYLIGYLGFFLHWVWKMPKGHGLGAWFHVWFVDNLRDIIIGWICYQIAMFIWWDMGLTILGLDVLPAGKPNLLSTIIAYSSDSIVPAFINFIMERIPEKWRKKLMGEVKSPEEVKP